MTIDILISRFLCISDIIIISGKGREKGSRGLGGFNRQGVAHRVLRRSRHADSRLCDSRLGQRRLAHAAGILCGC